MPELSRPGHERQLQRLTQTVRRSKAGSTWFAVGRSEVIRDAFVARIDELVGAEHAVVVVEVPASDAAPWSRIAAAAADLPASSVVVASFVPDERAETPSATAWQDVNLGREARRRAHLHLVLWVASLAGMPAVRDAAPDLWSQRTGLLIAVGAADFGLPSPASVKSVGVYESALRDGRVPRDDLANYAFFVLDHERPLGSALAGPAMRVFWHLAREAEWRAQASLALAKKMAGTNGVMHVHAAAGRALGSAWSGRIIGRLRGFAAARRSLDWLGTPAARTSVWAWTLWENLAGRLDRPTTYESWQDRARFALRPDGIKLLEAQNFAIQLARAGAIAALRLDLLSGLVDLHVAGRKHAEHRHSALADEVAVEMIGIYAALGQAADAREVVRALRLPGTSALSLAVANHDALPVSDEAWGAAIQQAWATVRDAQPFQAAGALLAAARFYLLRGARGDGALARQALARLHALPSRVALSPPEAVDALNPNSADVIEATLARLRDEVRWRDGDDAFATGPAFLDAEIDPVGELRAEAWRVEGRLLASERQFPEACEAFDRADAWYAGEPWASADRAEGWLERATCLLDSDPAAAAKAADRGIAILGEERDDTLDLRPVRLVAGLATVGARANARIDQPVRARALLDDALAVCRESGNAQREVDVLLAFAALPGSVASWDERAGAAQRALGMVREASMLLDEALALAALASLYAESGRDQEAAAAADQARWIAERCPSPAVARAVANLR